MKKIGWARLMNGGLSETGCKEVLRKRGVMVGDDFDPFYIEPVPSSKLKRIDADALPFLKEAVRSLRAGECLVVADLAHLGHERVWNWLARQVSERGGSVMNGKTGKLYDLRDADPVVVKTATEGADDTELAVRRNQSAAASRARKKSGKLGGAPRKFEGAAVDKAWSIWADPSYSAADVADASGVSEMTVRRHMVLDGREVGKIEAEALAEEGRWPKRKPK